MAVAHAAQGFSALANRLATANGAKEKNGTRSSNRAIIESRGVQKTPSATHCHDSTSVEANLISFKQVFSAQP
jgi:hypothetical protein